MGMGEGAENAFTSCRRAQEKPQSEQIILLAARRQEVLSGVRDRSKFELVKNGLRTFPDLEIGTGDYEEAASYYNHCRAKGIQGSFTDYVICAAAVRHELAIFTDDKDFLGYKTVLPIRLYYFEK